MASQPETPTYDAGVYQLEETDPVLGGRGNIANAPLLNLADRTAWLKQQVDLIEAQFAHLNSPSLTGTPTAPTPTTSDSSTKLATTAFVLAKILATLPSAVKILLTSNQTFYVATTGNDTTGDGSSGSPWATMQHAYNFIQQHYDLAGFTVTVSVANGSYNSGVIAVSPTVGGIINFVGNVGTPSSVSISVSNGNCFLAGGGNTLGGNFNISGFSLAATGSAAAFEGYGIATGTAGSIGFSNINFGSCSSGHIWASDYGVIFALGPYSISGGSIYHYLATSGFVNITSQTVTLTGTPAFSDAFAAAIGSGGEVFAPGNTYSGSATGFRFTAQQNGVVSSNGAGASYFPGSISGGQATGGQYV